MRRRRFVQELLTASALPLAATAAAQETTKPQQQPLPQPNTPARQVPQQPHGIPKLAVVQADTVSETEQRYFTADQFAVLEKLGDIFMPAAQGRPGAREAQAAEFLDFLISVSPADRQHLYCNGLDTLDKQANQKFHKPFAEVDAKQADVIIRPLLVARPWPQDLPLDPLENFVAQVHEDLTNATFNSREWAEATVSMRLREHGFNRTVGYYWNPIDPVVRD